VKFRLFVAILGASLGSAQGLIRQTIEWDPKNSIAHYQFGVMLFRQNDLQAAANEFQAALDGDLKPPDIKWWAHQKLGEIFATAGDLLRTQREFEQAERFKTSIDDTVVGALTAPRVVERTPAEYTPEARRAGLEGVVRVQCEVMEDGSVRNAAASESLGFGLDENAIEAVKHWRFEPGTLGDRPIAQTMEFEMEFQLPNKQSRWHLVGASFHPDPGVIPPSVATAKYPIGTGITVNAVDEGRILGAIGRLASATIAFEVDEHGQPGHFSVESASHEIWGSEAINLVRQWQFEPGTKAGVPVKTPCVLEFVWGPRDLPPEALRESRRYVTPPAH
jgi:TonB family protein